MDIPGVKAFLAELELHCLIQAIATFLDSEGEPLVLHLTRQQETVVYGENWGTKELFIAKLLVSCQPSGSLILRSFTSEVDDFTQLPIKELRGYILTGNGHDLTFEKLTSREMFACHNTDAETGEPLPLEQSVRYC